MLQFSNQFMQHYLPLLSPLAWKLYLHLLLTCTLRSSYQLQEHDFELDPPNQFVNRRQYQQELAAAKSELLSEQLLKHNFYNQTTWLISPEVHDNFSLLEKLWQQGVADLNPQAKEAINRSNLLPAKGCDPDNYELLQFLLTCNKGGEAACESSADPQPISPPTASLPEDDSYNELVQSINRSFLVGFSSYSWISLIDKMHYEYKLDNELIYLIFATLHSENKLYKEQVLNLTKELAKEQVLTAAAYDAWVSRKEKIKEREPLVKQALQRRTLTQAEILLINKWYDEYGYNDEIVTYLLSKSSETTNPTLNWFDAIITRWHKSGYKTLTEIKQGEESYKMKQAGRRHSNLSGFQSRIQKDKYTERQYDDDFYRKLLQGSKNNIDYD